MYKILPKLSTRRQHLHLNICKRQFSDETKLTFLAHTENWQGSVDNGQSTSRLKRNTLNNDNNDPIIVPPREGIIYSLPDQSFYPPEQNFHKNSFNPKLRQNEHNSGGLVVVKRRANKKILLNQCMSQCIDAIL